MTTRNIVVTLDKAREWYNSGNRELVDLALQVFPEAQLYFNFKNIKTLEDACRVLGLDIEKVKVIIETISSNSPASAAMYQLNIIKKALNIGYDMSLVKSTKNGDVYYPYNPFITKQCNIYDKNLKNNEVLVIGQIKYNEIEYKVLGGRAYNGSDAGLGDFCSSNGVGSADACFGFLGCATEKIAEHFGKYFGMLITQAKYGDLPDFEIEDYKF